MLEIKAESPKHGTPTHQGWGVRGKKGKIDGVTMWLKGISPTGGYATDYRSPHHERAAYIVNNMLNLKLVPPTVLSLVDGKVVSAMKWVRGSRPHGEKPVKLAVFDYIIANGDRHYGNWLITPSGRVWAIDNAYTFGNLYVDAFYYREALPPTVKRKLREALKNKEEFHRQLDSLVGRRQVTAIVKRIKKVLAFKYN